MRLKILSLHQPWATLCVLPSNYNPLFPAKPVETRGWSTGFRGWLGVHATAKKLLDYRTISKAPPFSDYIKDYEILPFGSIVGMVEISGCLPTGSKELDLFILHTLDHSSRPIENAENPEIIKRIDEIHSFGDFSAGRFGFTISDYVQFLRPIKARGAQGFWYHDMPHNIAETVTITTSQQLGIILDCRCYKPAADLYLIKNIQTGERKWYNEKSFAVGSTLKQ